MRKFSRQRGPTPSLSLRQFVQASFGFTLPELAILLGVSRSVLAMSEELGRTLPPAATQRLVGLFQTLSAQDHSPLPLAAAPPLLDDYEKETLRLRQQGLGIELDKLRQQLERCQTRLAQARLRQQVLPDLSASLAPAEERIGRWLAGWAARDPAQLRADEAALALLELRRRVLEFELAELEKLLGAT